MIFDIRWLPILLISLLVCWLAQWIGSMLTPWGLHLSIVGLFVVIPALFLQFKGGLFVALVCALMTYCVDAEAFKLSVPMVCLTFLFAYMARYRVHIDSKTHATVFTLLANTFLLLAMASLRGLHDSNDAAYWMRIFTDLIVSTLALTLLTPYYHTLIKQTLLGIGFSLTTDENVL